MCDLETQHRKKKKKAKKPKQKRKAMAVPTIALYASPPSSVCSTPHSSYDFELNSSPPSTCQKPVIGGLSCLFSSSSSVRSSSSFCSDELKSEELKELSLSSSYGYSSPSKFSGSFLKKDLSPVSVFQGPVSCCSSGSSCVVVGSARGSSACANNTSSPTLSFQSGLFNGFVRNAYGSCLDYGSSTSGLEVCGDELNVEELTFNIEVEQGNAEPYVKELLLGAQLRHKIFCEDFVVKAFYEAEKAHRGQVKI